MIPFVKVIKSDHFKKLGGAKSLAAPCPGMQKRAHPLQPPAPRGQGVQGVSNGKVNMVVTPKLAQKSNVSPQGPQASVGPERVPIGSGAGQPPQGERKKAKM